MSILNAYNLAQSFGHHDIFSGISGKIEHGNKIGLVGPNGVGKTSLLRILNGLDRPTVGGVSLARGTRLGYLHQEAVQTFANRDNTVHAEMLTVFAELQEQEMQMADMESRMAAGELSDTLFDEYSTLQQVYETGGGYEYETRIEQVLSGLDFGEDERHMPLAHLSGGQKTRALLARLLLDEPDLLVLDEPTNHLDVQAIEWLENMLKRWPGALLIVSHDRYFLDSVVNIVWEMSTTEIERYRGNYTAYVQQRQERWARRQKEFDATKERQEKEMAFIHKHIGSGRGHGMAKGKLRKLSTELGGGRRAYKASRAKEIIKGQRKPSGEWDQMNISLEAGQRSGTIVLRTRDLMIGYEEPLFTADNIKLLRGECAALIGPNGAGKTTFMRTIMAEMTPLTGSIELGASLQIGYFAQAHDNLNPKRRVIEELLSHQQVVNGKAMDVGQARHFLARFLFQEDDVFKPVRALSGGERGRLALAILANQGANFLLMDEPTNHLDIPAQEVLQTVLEGFGGTILLISHDRYLVNRLATQIWELQDGHLAIYPGPYRQFIGERQLAADDLSDKAKGVAR